MTEFVFCDDSQDLQTKNPEQLVANNISQIAEKRYVRGKKCVKLMGKFVPKLFGNCCSNLQKICLTLERQCQQMLFGNFFAKIGCPHRLKILFCLLSHKRTHQNTSAACSRSFVYFYMIKQNHSQHCNYQHRPIHLVTNR